MASSTTNEKTNQSTGNNYLPTKINSDTNANPNSMTSTGAIPKTKITSPTGISNHKRAKTNNNLDEIKSYKSEINGTCSQSTLDSYIQNNVDQEKQFNKNTSKLYNESCGNYKTPNNVINGVHNGSSAGLFGMRNQLSNEACFVNTINHRRRSEELINLSVVNGIEAVPSTSRDINNIKGEMNSNIRVAEQHKNSDDSECSSDTGNDDLSCSDDCCIYTYKGDVADLPSSFMNLDIPDNDGQEHSRAGSRGSSPEMDFLEMDFDPGPSCDADSDESSINSDIKSEEGLQNNNLNGEEQDEPQPNISKEQNPENSMDQFVNVSEQKNNLSQENFLSLTKKEPELQNVTAIDDKLTRNDSNLKVNLTQEPWIPTSTIQRTFYSGILCEFKGHHSSSGDLISPNENLLPSTSTSALDCRVNSSSSLYHSTMEKQLVLDNVLDKQPTSNEECASTIEKTMIWLEQEAALKQVTQIGTSACGATAVLNVLLALGYSLPTTDKLLESVETRLRKNTSPLIEYLKSRNVAGSTHKDLITGLQKLTNGQVYARFFHMYPERYINLSQWLCYWIRKGAVPIATLNLQKGIKPNNPVPDAWHHQMIFGVGPHGIYLTNPLERVEEGTLWHQLSSESVLLVKREDVISRWNNKTNLKDLIMIKDVRWHRLNVVGQVANVIREHHTSLNLHAVSRTHISIPAAYSAGITLAININNPACELLKTCPELPILNTLP